MSFASEVFRVRSNISTHGGKCEAFILVSDDSTKLRVIQLDSRAGKHNINTFYKKPESYEHLGLKVNLKKYFAISELQNLSTNFIKKKNDYSLEISYSLKDQKNKKKRFSLKSLIYFDGSKNVNCLSENKVSN